MLVTSQLCSTFSYKDVNSCLCHSHYIVIGVLLSFAEIKLCCFLIFFIAVVEFRCSVIIFGNKVLRVTCRFNNYQY